MYKKNRHDVCARASGEAIFIFFLTLKPPEHPRKRGGWRRLGTRGRLQGAKAVARVGARGSG